MKFLFPIQGNYRISQRFAETLIDYSRFGMKGHNGWDIAVARGTPILAVADGIIVEAVGGALPGAGGYGNVIRQLVPDGVTSLEWVYGHLLMTMVKAGDQVKMGQVIGLADSTGYSTGDHLHLGVRRSSLDSNELISAFRRYQKFEHKVFDTDNGYLGYFDPAPYFETDVPAEILAVDNRYGQAYNWSREVSWSVIHEKYLKQEALRHGVPYSDRLRKGAVYGFWDIETLLNPAMLPLWQNIHKPEFEKATKEGRLASLRFNQP